MPAPRRPITTGHLGLAGLAVAIALLGAVSFIGSDGQSGIAAPTRTAELGELLPPESDGDGGGAVLAHPLIGTSRARLDALLGAPRDAYVGGRYSFLTYSEAGATYRVVLEQDRVIEVSRIN